MPTEKLTRILLAKSSFSPQLSSVGRWAKYLYDSEDRLVTVTHATGQQTTYSYDSGNRMATIEDSLGGFRLSNKYDSTGRVIESRC
jgi:YD repeat-containing protein